MIRTATIIIELPEGFDKSEDSVELVDYIDDALSSMGGCRHPDDWLFRGVKMRSVRIGKEKYT